MQKSKKYEIVDALSKMFREMSFVVVSKHCGLCVADFNDLRRKIRQANGKCVVVKNNLAKLAIKGTQYEKKLSDLFLGPISLIYSNDDPSSIAKILMKFYKSNDKIELLAAATINDRFSPDDVKQLAALPSLEELRAKLCGVFSAPMSSLIAALQAGPRDLTGIISAYSDKKN